MAEPIFEFQKFQPTQATNYLLGLERRPGLKELPTIDIEKAREEYKEKRKNYINKLYQDWKFKFKNQHPKWPEEQLQFNPQFADRDWREIIGGKKEEPKLNPVVRRNWMQYLLDQEKERAKNMTRSERIAEAKVSENPWDVFFNKTVNSLTFNFVDPYNPRLDRELWETTRSARFQKKEAEEAYPKAAAAGEIAGTIVSYMGLSHLANVAGVPSLISKLAARPGKVGVGLSKALKVLGKPKVWADKFHILRAPLYRIGFKYGGTAFKEAGTVGLTSAIVKSIDSSLREAGARYRMQDTMNDKEYKKWIESRPSYAAVIGSGLLQGYGISLINDPNNWHGRFLGDALYSGATSILRGITTGEWSWTDYWKDFALGHVMGEIQGRIFSPSMKQMKMAQRYKLTKRLRKYFADEYDLDFGDSWWPGTALEIANIRARAEFGRPLTNDEIATAVLKLGEAHGKTDIDIMKSMSYPRVSKITKEDWQKPLAENIKGLDFNRITGFQKKFADGTIPDKTNAKLSFRSIYENTKVFRSENAAERIVYHGTRIVKNIIEEINAAHGNRGAKIDMATPGDDIDVYFKQTGFSRKEETDNLRYIESVLHNNYSEVYDYPERFAILLEKPDGKYNVISSFKGAEIKKEGKPLDPYSELELPGWKQVQIDDANQLGKKSSEEINAAKYQQDIKDNQTAPEIAFREFTEKKAQVDPDGSMMFQALKNFKDIADRRLSDVISLKKKFGENFNEARKWLKETADIFASLDTSKQGELQRAAIYNWSAVVKEGESYANKVMNGWIDDNGVRHEGFTERYVNNEGIKDNQWIDRGNKLVILALSSGEAKRFINAGSSPHILTKKIVFKDPDFSIEKMKGKPVKLNNDLLHVRAISSDPYLMMKLMVQLYGIKPESVVKYCKGYINELETLMEGLQKEAGYSITMADKEFNVAKKLKEDFKGAVIEYLEKHTDFTPTGDLDAIGVRQDLELKIKSTPETNTRKYILRLLDNYYNTDPETWVYVPQISLRAKGNQERFRGALQQIANGNVASGVDAVSPLIKAAKGRKFANPYQLIQAQWEVMDAGIEHFVFTELQYLKTKLENRYTLDNLKYQFLLKHEQLIDKQRMDPNFDGRRQFLNEEVGGFFYNPTDTEFKAANNEIKEIDRDLEAYKQGIKPNTPAFKHVLKLNSRKAELQQWLAMANNLKDTWASPEGQAYMNSHLRKDIYKPINLKSFLNDGGDISRLSKELNRNREKLRELESLGDTEQIRKKIKTLKTRQDNIINLVEKATGRQKISRIMRQCINSENSYNVPGGEGLYFNRGIYKALEQYVFRNNYRVDEAPGSFPKKAFRLYQKVNSNLKIWRLVKPIMIAYDTMQGLVHNPSFLFHIPTAIRDRMYRTSFFRRMEKKDLFNRILDIEPVYSSAFSSVYRTLGKSAFLGKVVKDATGDETFLKRVWDTSKNVRNGLQSVNWTVDEILRTAVARSMERRITRGVMSNAKFAKLSNARKREIADLHVAEWTNRAMVHYSRMPNDTRRFLNSFFIYPTYRWQTLRMYKEMITDFGKGIYRMFGGTPEARFKYGETNREQIWGEISPFLYKIGWTAVAKVLLASFFDGTYGSILDAITGYRLKRKKGQFGQIDAEMQFLSLSTPLFEIEKILTRGRKYPYVLFKYNMAAFPGLINSWIQNEDIITGKNIWNGAFWKKPAENTARLGLNAFKNYFPFGTDVALWADDDIRLAGKLINSTGIATYYSSGNPLKLMHDYEIASDAARSIKERRKAQRDLWNGMRRLRRQWFGEDLMNMETMLKKNTRS